MNRILFQNYFTNNKIEQVWKEDLKKPPRTVSEKVKSQGAYFQMGENPLFDMT